VRNALPQQHTSLGDDRSVFLQQQGLLGNGRKMLLQQLYFLLKYLTKDIALHDIFVAYSEPSDGALWNQVPLKPTIISLLTEPGFNNQTQPCAGEIDSN